MKYVSHCVFIFLFVLSAKACADFLHWNCSLSNSAKTKLPIIQKSKVALFYFNFFIYIFSYWLIKHNCIFFMSLPPGKKICQPILLIQDVFSSNVKLKNCCHVAEFSQTILHKGILWWTRIYNFYRRFIITKN